MKPSTEFPATSKTIVYRCDPGVISNDKDVLFMSKGNLWLEAILRKDRGRRVINMRGNSFPGDWPEVFEATQTGERTMPTFEVIESIYTKVPRDGSPISL